MLCKRFAVLCMILSASTFIGCDAEKGNSVGNAKGDKASGTRRIVLLNNTDSPFWDAARAGIEKAGED